LTLQYNKSVLQFDGKHLIAASIGNIKSTAWFNGIYPHTLPLSVNTLNRAILKTFAGNEYDITVTNEPFKALEKGESLEEVQAKKVIFYRFNIFF
jgi:hypothetical protein